MEEQTKTENNRKRSHSFILVPKNNEEIFELREALREEKENKRALNQTTSMNRLAAMPSNRLRNNKGLYITEFSTIKKNEKVVKQTVPIELVGRKNIFSKIQGLGFKAEESVRDFINKTREIILMKYSIEIKKERAVRLKETYQNQIESIQDSIAAIRDAKDMFVGEFFEKFEKYVKHLEQQREKDKNELNILLDDKMKTDSKIKKLENEIFKKKEKLVVLKSYQEFMMCVKARNLNIFNLGEKQKQSFKRSITYTTSAPIYNTEQELIDDLKSLEDENIKLLDTYNQKVLIFQEQNKQYEKMKDDFYKFTNEESQIIKNKEKNLSDLKLKFETLKEEKQRLLNEREEHSYENTIRDKKKSMNRISESVIKNRISNVYKSATEFKMKMENEDNSDLGMLGYIEKALNVLQKYKKECEVNYEKKDNLKKIEEALEKERKFKKADEQKRLDLHKREKLKKDIYERNNKVHKLARRRVPERLKPIDKLVVKKSEMTINDDDLFEELICYESDN